MKKTLVFLVALFLTGWAGSAQADWVSSLRAKVTLGPRGRNALKASSSMCLRKTCAAVGKNCGTVSDGCGGMMECGTCSGVDTCGGGGTENVCGQTCYDFAFLTEDGEGLENVMRASNCSASPTINLTRNTDANTKTSHLSSGRGQPRIGFFQEVIDDEGSVGDPWMSLMNMIGSSWTTLSSGTPPQFTSLAVAWDALGRLAVLTRETDGQYAIRFNANTTYPYPAETVVAHRMAMDFDPPQDVEWVPTTDGTPSRHLIISYGSSLPGTKLWSFKFNEDFTAGRLAPLKETTSGSPAEDAMLGFQPALGRLGTSLIFVRRVGEEYRIHACNLDFSEMDARIPRAYCPDAWELTHLRSVRGDLTSPSVSHDNQWLYFSRRIPGDTNADVYRTRFDRFHLHQLTATRDIDEREIAALTPWVEFTSVGVVQSTMQVREEEPRYEVNTSVQYRAAPIAPARCSADSDCPSGQECGDDDVCRKRSE